MRKSSEAAMKAAAAVAKGIHSAASIRCRGVDVVGSTRSAPPHSLFPLSQHDAHSETRAERLGGDIP